MSRMKTVSVLAGVVGLAIAQSPALGLGFGDFVVTDSVGEKIWVVEGDTGNRSILSDNISAGSGPAFDLIQGLAVGPGGRIFAADDDVNAIFEIDPSTGNRTIISQLGVRGTGPIVSPSAITVDGNGTIFVGDSANLSVMRIDPATGNRTVIVGRPGGTMVGTGELPSSVTGLTVDRNGSIFAVSRNERVLKIDPSTGVSSVFVQGRDGKGDLFTQGRSIDILPGGDFILSNQSDRPALMRLDPVTGVRVSVSNALFGGGAGAVVEASGTVMVAERNRFRLTRVFEPLITPLSTVPVRYSDVEIHSDSSNGTGPGLGFVEHIAVVGGSNVGIAQAFAFLPNAEAPEGSFGFEDVPGDGRWFDPIMATGYDYETDGESLFTAVLLPDELGGDGLYTILDPINGDVVLAQGVTYTFDTPVESFGVRGIGPAVDGEDPLAFPTFLTFDELSVSFSMTPVVPEPALLGVALLGVFARRRR